MIKIFNPSDTRQTIGGGFTFRRSLIKALSKDEFSFVDSLEECDILFITGVTMVDRNTVHEAKRIGKKIIMRVDNIPRDSRNRGTAFSRMLDFAKLSDFIIFQSEWAKDYAGWWFEQNGVDITNRSSIIYNGVDKDAFYEDKTERVKDRYMFVQYNRDENKRMTEAFYLFHQAYRKNKESELYLAGRFSSEMMEYNFDFFAGEPVSYLGVIEEPQQLGDMFRSCEYLLFPAFADASPNTVMEAIACGCKVIGVNETGGTKELINIKGRSIEDMGNDYKLIFEKLCQK